MERKIKSKSMLDVSKKIIIPEIGKMIIHGDAKSIRQAFKQKYKFTPEPFSEYLEEAEYQLRDNTVALFQNDPRILQNGNLRATLSRVYQIPPESIHQNVINALHKMLLEKKTLRVHNAFNHQNYTIIAPAHDTLQSILQTNLAGHIPNSSTWKLGYRNPPRVPIPIDMTPFELEDLNLILIPR